VQEFIEKAAILFVSRPIHIEALEVLYNLNPVIVKRGDFCTLHGRTPQLPFRKELVRHLSILTLELSTRCKLKLRNECLQCSQTMVPLLETIAQLPRLKSMNVNISDHFDQIQKLRAVLPTSLPGMRWVCTGLGEYNLTGEGLRIATWTFEHPSLIECWPKIAAQNPARNTLRQCESVPTMSSLVESYGSLAHTLSKILRFQDEMAMLPKSIVDIWPAREPRDLRVMVSSGSPSFCQAFVDALEELRTTPLVWWDLRAVFN